MSCTETKYPPLVSAAHTLTKTKQNAALTSMKVKHQVCVQRRVECSNTQTFIFIQRAGLIKWIKPSLVQIKGLPHSSEDFDWLSIWKPVIFTHLLVKALFFTFFFFFFFFRTCSDVGGVYLRQEACPNMARAAEIPPVGALICATTSLQPILQRPLIIKPGKPWFPRCC